MKVKLTEAVDLMSRSTKSCTSMDQLTLAMEWIADIIVPFNFLDDDAANVLIARGSLLKMVEKQKNSIQGIGDIEELELKTQTIHDEDVEMDIDQFNAMTPEQQKTWLEYLAKNKDRVGLI